MTMQMRKQKADKNAERDCRNMLAQISHFGWKRHQCVEQAVQRALQAGGSGKWREAKKILRQIVAPMLGSLQHLQPAIYRISQYTTRKHRDIDPAISSEVLRNALAKHGVGVKIERRCGGEYILQTPIGNVRFAQKPLPIVERFGIPRRQHAGLIASYDNYSMVTLPQIYRYIATRLAAKTR